MAITVGDHVRVIERVPAAPWCADRVGEVTRVYWSTHPRLAAPEWRALVHFAKQRRRQSGATIAYSLPLGAIKVIAGDRRAA